MTLSISGARAPTAPFSGAGVPGGLTLLDYWRWAYSDLIGNTDRGVLAEFIVGILIGAIAKPREAWEPFDLRTTAGQRVEVKSSAYWQSWHQGRPSRIQFKIPRTLAWDSDTDEFAEEARRNSDIYVFCVLGSPDLREPDPMDMEQWEFHVASSAALDERFGDQKTVGLRKLMRVTVGPLAAPDLAAAVEAATPDGAT